MRAMRGVTGGLSTAAMMSLLLVGCGDGQNSMGNPTGGLAPVVTAISPAEGAADVPRNATIAIRFNTPMDKSSVMGAFHLAGGADMEVWMDSASHHQGRGGMGMMNMDPMMSWMDSIQYEGQWHWNSAQDSCWFIADSMFMPDADHMIYLYGAMRSHDGTMMKVDSMAYGGPMYHFHTQP